jgi:hypothetical protein
MQKLFCAYLIHSLETYPETQRQAPPTYVLSPCPKPKPIIESKYVFKQIDQYENLCSQYDQNHQPFGNRDTRTDH